MARAFPMAPSFSPRGAQENTFRWPGPGGHTRRKTTRRATVPAASTYVSKGKESFIPPRWTTASSRWL
jgi:hypothetical protein